MTTLTVNQMEDVSGDRSTAGCIIGATVGIASIVLVGLGTAGIGVTAASLLLAELSPVFGCLL